MIAVLARLLPAHRRRGMLVTPATILRWHRQLVRRRWTTPHPRPGAAIPAGVRALIVRLATENPAWGYDAYAANSPDSATRLSTRSPCTGSTRSSSSNTHHFSCAEGGPIRTAWTPDRRRPRRVGGTDGAGESELGHPVGTCAMGPDPTGPPWSTHAVRCTVSTGSGRGRLGDADHPVGRNQRAHDRCRRADRGMADRVTKRARRKASSDPVGSP